MYHLDRPMYLLGYLNKEAKVFLIDKEFGISSYTLNLAIIEYKTLVIRGDMDAADSTLDRIPKVLTCYILELLPQLIVKYMRESQLIDFRYVLS